MKKIHVLAPNIANRIAAGEVVERPQSVVKELVENAIDAGASAITIEIENGGIDSILVRDNGHGIAPEDVPMAFLRHATSKIETSDDIRHIETLGFRGEALASIASVADVTVKTRQEGKDEGTLYRIDNGEEMSNRPVACPEGTVFDVRNLFSKTPARLKFLKSSRSEAGAIGDYVSRMILCYPDVSFSFLNNGRSVYKTFGENDLRKSVFAVYGNDITANLKTVSYDDGYISVTGFIGTPEISRPNRNYQTLILNGRYVKDYKISNAVQRAYDTRLLIGKYPFYVLKIALSPYEVDINVHPQKLEARFSDEMRVTNAVYTAVFRALNAPAVSPTTIVDKPLVKSSFISNDDFPEEKHVSVLPGLDPIMNAAVKETANNSVHEPSFSVDKTFPSNFLPGIKINTTHVSKPVSNEKSSVQAKTLASVEQLPVFRFASKRPEVPEPDTVADTVFPSEFTYIGKVLSGYLIIESDGCMFMIDQHAAHERLIFETLSKREYEVASQPLIIPRNLVLSPDDFTLLQQHESDFRKFGFDFSYNDAYSVSIIALPVINGKLLPENAIIDALEDYRVSGESAASNRIRSSIIQASCKHAVKINEALADKEIDALLQAYKKGDIPLNCPHGRPVIIRFTKSDIEKAFKRIV